MYIANTKAVDRQFSTRIMHWIFVMRVKMVKK